MNKSCANQTPRWFTGHWREWHRGHGCDVDDGKPRSADAVAEISRHVSKPDRSTGFITSVEWRDGAATLHASCALCGQAVIAPGITTDDPSAVLGMLVQHSGQCSITRQTFRSVLDHSGSTGEASMKTTTVVAVEKFRDHPAPCRHCGQIYEHHQRHIDPDHHQCCGGTQSPLVRCPACGCPADPPLNPMEQ